MQTSNLFEERQLSRHEMKEILGGFTMTMGCQNIGPDCYHIVCVGGSTTVPQGGSYNANGEYEVTYITLPGASSGTCYCPDYGDLPSNCHRQD